MENEIFGETEDGAAVNRVTINGGGLTASILSWGASLQDLRLAGHDEPLVLGFSAFADYLQHSPYFGATPGRYANRIAHGRFTLDGLDHQLDRNEGGLHHLHGGREGIGKRIWRIADHGDNHVRLEIDDPDGQMGYPGNCRIACTYRLGADGILSMVHEAETDQPTLCNMAHHSYFNLDGRPDVLDHEIRIAADHYLPVDDKLIPTGEVRPVAGTPFDFRKQRAIRHDADGRQCIYDHNFCLSDARVEKRPVAQVSSPFSGVKMDVWTSEPGLQFYAGHKVETPVPGLDGKAYGAFAGLCLEAQIWPDSPNHNGFPSAVLRPGEKLLQETDYRFSRG